MEKNNTTAYQKALELMGDQRWSEASALLEDLVAQKPEPEYVRSLVSSLSHDHQYMRAMDYLASDPTTFYHSLDWSKLAVTVFLASRYFISARLFVSGGPEKWRKKLTMTIATAEQVAEKEYTETIRQGLRRFYHLGDATVQNQQMRLREAYQLPLVTFLTGVKFVLRDPFVHSLVRANIIEVLRELKISESLTYYWLDKQEYQVIPAELPELENILAVKKVEQRLQERLANDNPSLYKAALQQLNLQLLFLMPRISKVITQPIQWADYLIATLNGQTLAGVPEEISSWQQLIMEKLEHLSTGKG